MIVVVIVIVIVTFVPGIETIRKKLHAYSISIDDIVQAMGFQAGHSAEIETVPGDGDATESRHVVVLMMVDRHYGGRRWFLRATGTRWCLCRHARTRPVPGRKNLADNRNVCFTRKSRPPF